MRAGRASRTAVLVGQGRAVAEGRILPGRFSDPTGLPMLREDERGVVELVRAGDAPTVYRERAAYEMVRGVAEVIVPRTIAINDAAREAVRGKRERTEKLPAPAAPPRFVAVDFGRDRLGEPLAAW